MLEQLLAALLTQLVVALAAMAVHVLRERFDTGAVSPV
jgi:hypothetical protein